MCKQTKQKTRIAMALAEAKAIIYKNYDNETKGLVTEIFVPHMGMTLNERWEVRRTPEISINRASFTPDISELANPEYVTFMLHELKQCEEFNKTIAMSQKNILINGMLMDIMNELVKIYDEKVRLAFLQKRVDKKISEICDIHDLPFDQVIETMKH